MIIELTPNEAVVVGAAGLALLFGLPIYFLSGLFGPRIPDVLPEQHVDLVFGDDPAYTSTERATNDTSSEEAGS